MRLDVSKEAKLSLLRSMRVLSATYSKTYLVLLRKRVGLAVVALKTRTSGQIEPDLQDLGKGHRRVIVGPFKIIYFVEDDTVHVTDIFDARRDPKEMKG